MHPTAIHAIDPLERFVAIYGALLRQSDWWVDHGWLRFAAQAAVLRPASPEETARAIAAGAAELRARTSFFDALGSSAGLVVAAELVQIGDSVDAFLAEAAAARVRLREAGIGRAGAFEVMALLALRVLADGAAIGAPAVARLRDIHHELRKHHWWLTGRDDLPACAALTACAGSPPEIGGLVEAVYQGLAGAGFARGQVLQTAAELLPHAGLAAGQAVARLRALSDAAKAAGLDLVDDDLAALALLAPLEQPAPRVVERLGACLDRLQRLEPAIIGSVDVAIAADLAFLDLARFDAGMRPLTGADGERMLARIRRMRAASTALVRVPPATVVTDGMIWNVREPFPL